MAVLRKYLFLLFILTTFLSLPQITRANEQDTLITYINALHQKVIEEGRLTDQLSESDLASLPMGVARYVGDRQYIILIDHVRFTPAGAFFNAYISLSLPISPRPIAFYAENIGFQPGGLSKSGVMKLSLASYHEREINDKVTLKLPVAQGRNFIEWDCNGFRSLNLKGVFEFSKEVIIPAESGQEKVEASFEVNTSDPGSIIAAVNIAPFQVKALKGFTFEVNDAIADYSDLYNPDGMVFPVDYHSDAEFAMLWQGFFLRNLTITLPKELMTRSGRMSIEANNLIIDQHGVSGAFTASNIFDLTQGSLDGWPLSINTLTIGLLKNQLNGAGFKGELSLPIFEKPMGYEALVYNEQNETNFLFSVQTGEKFSAPILGAEIELHPSSHIAIRKEDGRYRPEAILHGTADIKSGKLVNLEQVQFQNLHLATVKPYVRSGAWSLIGDKQRVADFPVRIDHITVVHNEGVMKLKADVSMGLMDKADKGFGVKTAVEVLGRIEEEEVAMGEEMVTEQHWAFDRVDVHDVHINVNQGIYNLEGTLKVFNEDPAYGSGFMGNIRAGFKPGVAVDATAQFGSINNIRYYFVDARAMMPSPMGTGLAIYGFGGGLYYHMAAQNFDRVSLSDAQQTGVQELKVGQTHSGLQYMPDASVGLGMRASVILGTTPSEKAFNADATFEMAFNNNGGVRYIGFLGQGYFMSGFENRSAAAPMYAELAMMYDFKNETFHATIDTYVNAFGLIRGIHDRGLAGTAVIHFSPQEWYIHLGTPDQRIGLNFVGIVDFGGIIDVKVGAYFMVGTNIPGMPAPPPEVSEILGDMDLDLMRDENALGTGSGFAFGTYMQVGTGRLKFLMFYGEFNAGLGFDIMLKDYGNAQCAGRNGPIGINGWYASGQAYAYVMGRIGIKVDMKFFSGEFDILKIGAAAVLQAKLPNPTYMQGIVGGEFSILGGMVKGNCRFKLTIGEECEIIGVSETTGIKVISDVSPNDGDKEVSVFTTPQVAFAMAIGKPYEILDNDDNFKSYRVQLDHFKVTHNGAPVDGEIDWNDRNDVAIFRSYEILPPEAELEVSVKILWEEKVRYSWQPLGGASSQEFEVETRKFKTSKAPNYIPEENVKYTYPLKGQYNFHKKEFPYSYITLKSGQSYLFKSPDDEGLEWRYLARMFNTQSGQIMDVPLTYHSSGTGGGEVRWDTPDELQPESVYGVRVVKVPMETEIANNVTFGSEQVLQEGENTVEVAKSEIEGTLALANEFLLYETQFRTSKYNTFSDKLNAVSGEQSIAIYIEGWNLVKLGYSLQSDEILGKQEIYGWKEAEPLIQIEAGTDNEWYSKYIYPHLYQNYPIDNELVINEWTPSDRREGIPPLRAMLVYQSNRNLIVEEGDITAMSIPGDIYFNYDLEYFSFMDYDELVTKAVNNFVDTDREKTAAVNRLVSQPHASLLSNQRYGFKLMYVLPGGKLSTTRNYFIKY